MEKAQLGGVPHRGTRLPPVRFSNMDPQPGGASGTRNEAGLVRARFWLTDRRCYLGRQLLAPRSASTARVATMPAFAMRSGDPAQCAARCERDGRCRAWAFSYPATEDANAVCWLKSRVTPRVEAACCVSGVRGTGVIEPKSGATEFGDRPLRRRLPALRCSGRTERQELRSRLRSRGCAAAPGLMSGRAMSAPPRSAFSRTASPGRPQAVLHFRAWCGRLELQRRPHICPFGSARQSGAAATLGGIYDETCPVRFGVRIDDERRRRAPWLGQLRCGQADYRRRSDRDLEIRESARHRSRCREATRSGR